MSVSAASRAFLDALDSNNTTSAVEHERKLELMEALAAEEEKPVKKKAVKK